MRMRRPHNSDGVRQPHIATTTAAGLKPPAPATRGVVKSAHHMRSRDVRARSVTIISSGA